MSESRRSQFRETNAASPSDPFQQGDLIRLTSNDGSRVSHPFGLIINADCDLAHCKIDGVVSYLPIFPFDLYFREFWIPAYVQDRRVELRNLILEMCRWSEADGTPLEDWIRAEDASVIAARIAQTRGVKLGQIQPKLVELARIILSDLHDTALLKKIAEDQNTNLQSVLSKFAKRALRDLGDGSFFINEIVGVQSVGFVARLRRIYALAIENVFSSEHQFSLSVRRQGICAIRIAKLSNVYRFKIAQLFAYQFSRIGLPDELTELNELAVQAALIENGVHND